MSDHAEPRIDLRALAVEYLRATVRFSEADVDRLVKLLARVDSDAWLDAICRSAQEADAAALEGGRPDNLKATNPRAAYQAGACRAAWRIRSLKQGAL